MRSSPRVALAVAVVVLASLAGCTGIGSDGGASPTESETGETPEPPGDDGATGDDGTSDETPTGGPGTDGRPADGTGTPPETDAGNTSATFLTSEGNVTATLEIANTSSERTAGLMGRESLPDDHGMVFVYPDADERSFWMKNTSIPLDMIFVASNGTVLNVEHADPEPTVPDGDLERYRSEGPARYVIELEQGFANRTGVEAGTDVAFHEELRAADGGGQQFRRPTQRPAWRWTRATTSVVAA